MEEEGPGESPTHMGCITGHVLNYRIQPAIHNTHMCPGCSPPPAIRLLPPHQAPPTPSGSSQSIRLLPLSQAPPTISGSSHYLRLLPPSIRLLPPHQAPPSPSGSTILNHTTILAVELHPHSPSVEYPLPF